MKEAKWEKGPWRNEITYNGAGYVSRVQVFGAENRVVSVTTFTGMKRNRAGQLEATPEAKSDTTTESQPALICDCGIPYAGLAATTLVAHGDLIAAAPELYESVDALCLALNMHHGLEPPVETAKRIEKERGNATANHYLKACAALAKARGESPDAK
jgi:hypothetical protein